jgi:hypothetical protein
MPTGKTVRKGVFVEQTDMIGVMPDVTAMRTPRQFILGTLVVWDRYQYPLSGYAANFL